MAVSTTAAFAGRQTDFIQDAAAGAELTTIVTSAAIAPGTPGDAVWSGTGSVVAILKRQSSAAAPALACTATMSNKPAAALLADNDACKRYVLFNNSAATVWRFA